MQFNAEEFRNSLENQNTASYLKVFIRPLKRGEEIAYEKWFSEVFQQLLAILRGGSEDAGLTVQACKFILSLILLGQVDICNTVGSLIYPTIYKVSQYDRHKPLKERGTEYFITKLPQNPSKNINEAKLRRLGVEFVRFALESVKMWAIWIPQSFAEPIHLSRYSTGFRKLQANGLVFPPENELVFYSSENVDAIQRRQLNNQIRIHELELEVFQEGSYLSNEFQNSSISKMRGYQRSAGENSFMKPFIKNGPMKSSFVFQAFSNKKVDEDLDLSTSGEIPKLKQTVERLEGQVSYLTKVNRSLHDEIRKLNEEIDELKGQLERLKSEHNTSMGNLLSNQQLKSNDLNFTAQFKSTNQLMKTAQSLPKLECGPLQPVKPIELLVKENQELKLLLLKEIAQKNQLSGGNTLIDAPSAEFPIDQLYKFIGEQEQIRYRKGFLKQKQILYQNNYLQVGCMISPLMDTNKVNIKIVLTNVTSRTKLFNLSCRLVNLSGDTAIRSREVSGVTVFPSSQEKIECEAAVSGRRQANIRMCISYSTESGDLFQKTLLVPLSKLKFISFVEPTSDTSSMFANRMCKTGELCPKVLPQLGALSKFIPTVRQNRSSEQVYCVYFVYMDGLYRLKLSSEPESRLTRMEIFYKHFNEQANAKDLLSEFAFVFFKS